MKQQPNQPLILSPQKPFIIPIPTVKQERKSLNVRISDILRDSIHNFSLEDKNELDNDVYFTRLKYFIELLEGSRNEAYYDGIPDPDNRSRFISMSKFNSFDLKKRKELEDKCLRINKKRPIVTVGIGLNIEEDTIREKYDVLLGVPGLMDKVYNGKLVLTNDQVSLIFKDCMQGRLIELKKIYGSDWAKLRANERICLHSLYFNYPKLADGTSSFRKYIKEYIKTNDVKYLKLAIKEVAEKSNPKKTKGIQNRRDCEAALLASHECGTFTKPCDKPTVPKSIIVHLNNKVVPLGIEGSCERGVNSDYFIWRTKMDGDVRHAHMLLEGRVFHKDHPPEYLPGSTHNCRCHSEEIPDHVLVMDKSKERKAFNLYLRTGLKIGLRP